MVCHKTTIIITASHLLLISADVIRMTLTALCLCCFSISFRSVYSCYFEIGFWSSELALNKPKYNSYLLLWILYFWLIYMSIPLLYCSVLGWGTMLQMPSKKLITSPQSVNRMSRTVVFNLWCAYPAGMSTHLRVMPKHLMEYVRLKSRIFYTLFCMQFIYIRCRIYTV